MSKQKFEEMKEKESADLQMWDLHKKKDSTPLSFEIELPNELFGIEPIKAKEMVSGLSTIFAEREVLKDAYLDVIELEINSENLPTFKELRNKFVKIRTSINKWHKINKAFYLAGGRFVDEIKNKEIAETEEIEDKLMEAENFFENQEKQKAKDLNDIRISKISPWVENAKNMDFKDFSEEDFEDFVFGKKTKFEQRITEEKAESERLEKERIEKEEAIRLQAIENARLKAEAEAREVKAQAEQKERERLAKIESDKLAKERAENEAKLKAIQMESDKKAAIEHAKMVAVQQELKAKKDAEIKAENERIEKEKAEKLESDKLAKAPIKKQLTLWVDNFEIPLPKVENETSLEIVKKFESFKKWAKSEIEK